MRKHLEKTLEVYTHSYILRALLWLTKASVVVISVVIVCATMAQVIFRYVVLSPLPWSEELARYCFVWIVFLGGAIGLSRGAHLGVDLLVNLLPFKLQRAIETLSSVCIVIFALVVINASLPVLQMNMYQRSPALGLQMSWVYAAIPLSMGLIAAVSVERIIFSVLSHPSRGGRV